MPNAQGGADPKGTKGGPDFQALGERYLANKKAEKEALQARLTQKLSDSEKLQIERQVFEIEKELFNVENNPTPQLNVVEQRIRDMKLDPAKENYLLDAAKKVTNQEDADALIDFISGFAGATGDKTPNAPDSIDTPPVEGEGKPVEVGYSAQDIANPETRDIAKANVLNIVTELAAKGV
jgi:hypothetical protein